MGKSLEEYVAENSRQLRRIEGQSVRVGGENDAGQTLTLGETRITIEFKLKFWRRDLGSGLISGHPNQQYGANRGEAGKGTPTWNLVDQYLYSDSEDFDAELTRSGQNTILKALTADQSATIGQIAVGPDLPSIEPEDGAFSWKGAGRVDRTTKVGARFRFDRIGPQNKVGALKLYTVDNQEFCKIDIPDIGVTDNQEFRCEVFMRFGSRSLDSTVLTGSGRRLAARSLRDGSGSRGIDEVVFGGESDIPPQVSQVSLEDRIISTKSQNEINNTVLTVQGKLFTSQPSEQPIVFREASLEDNNGNMLFRNTFSDTPKDSTFALRAVGTFRVTESGTDAEEISDGGLTVSPQIGFANSTPLSTEIHIERGSIGGLNTTGYGLPVIAEALRRKIESGSVKTEISEQIVEAYGRSSVNAFVQPFGATPFASPLNAETDDAGQIKESNPTSLSADESVTV